MNVPGACNNNYAISLVEKSEEIGFVLVLKVVLDVTVSGDKTELCNMWRNRSKNYNKSNSLHIFVSNDFQTMILKFANSSQYTLYKKVMLPVTLQEYSMWSPRKRETAEDEVKVRNQAKFHTHHNTAIL